jgi:hypothetical protein
MSSEKYVYIGVYFKVYMPKEKYQSSQKQCPYCHRYTHADFCSTDGNRTVAFEQERLTDFYDLCQEAFGYGDQFSTGNIHNDEFAIVLGNSSDQPGYIIVEDDTEQELPKEDFSGDWQLLADFLDGRGIKYEKHFGVVAYWM